MINFNLTSQIQLQNACTQIKDIPVKKTRNLFKSVTKNYINNNNSCVASDRSSFFFFHSISLKIPSEMVNGVFKLKPKSCPNIEHFFRYQVVFSNLTQPPTWFYGRCLYANCKTRIFLSLLLLFLVEVWSRTSIGFLFVA